MDDFSRLTIALVAHDMCKEDMLDWARFNSGTLSEYNIVATGTTGSMVAEATGLDVTTLASGPYGGDAQIAAMIVEHRVDMLVFFWDPLTPQPHDPDVKALLRLAVLSEIPLACNRATADLVISSPVTAQLSSRAVSASV